MVSIKMPPLVEASFVRRLNRFQAEIKLEGTTCFAHVPNSGRLRELLYPGGRILVASRQRPGRKTMWEVLMAYHPSGKLVAVDARLPNYLFSKVLEAHALPELDGYSRVMREYRFRESRLDFLLTGEGKYCLIEVKSVTLVEDGYARFPDAPTLRGARHLMQLAEAVKEGFRAIVIFLAQRPDAYCFKPNDPVDPNFGLALRSASAEGVEVYAYNCSVTPQEVAFGAPIPVDLS